MRGETLEKLQTLSKEDRSKYGALTAALRLGFGDEHLKQVFENQVKDSSVFTHVYLIHVYCNTGVSSGIQD